MCVCVCVIFFVALWPTLLLCGRVENRNPSKRLTKKLKKKKWKRRKKKRISFLLFIFCLFIACRCCCCCCSLLNCAHFLSICHYSSLWRLLAPLTLSLSPCSPRSFQFQFIEWSLSSWAAQPATPSPGFCVCLPCNPISCLSVPTHTHTYVYIVCRNSSLHKMAGGAEMSRFAFCQWRR